MKKIIEESFKSDMNFNITFGNTIFRGNDLSAVSFTWGVEYE